MKQYFFIRTILNMKKIIFLHYFKVIPHKKIIMFISSYLSGVRNCNLVLMHGFRPKGIVGGTPPLDEGRFGYNWWCYGFPVGVQCHVWFCSLSFNHSILPSYFSNKGQGPMPLETILYIKLMKNKHRKILSELWKWEMLFTVLIEFEN